MGNFLNLDELNILKITFRNGLEKILRGNFCGKILRQILAGNLGEKSCRKILREILRENLAGNSCGKILREILAENLVGNAVGNSPYLSPNHF